jgi:hypothetical protein
MTPPGIEPATFRLMTIITCTIIVTIVIIIIIIISLSPLRNYLTMILTRVSAVEINET